ncbi:unnamed protein product [Amoebophrya sp. A25]|nr:unnamed protein product [Amoebophrya sp. A25]|eukprot:GSA25T00000139001.1
MRQGFPVSHAAKAHFRSFSQKAIERNVLRHALFTCDLPSRRTMSSHVVSKTARGRTTSSSWLRSTSTSSNAPLLHAAWSTNGRTGFARSTSSTRSFGSSTDKNYSLANEELLSLSSSIGASATPDTRVPTQHEATASSIVDQRAGGGLEQGLDHLLVAPDRIDATTTGSALTSEVAVQMETSSSHFSSIGEFFYMPVHGVHECLQFLHDTAGCNWVAVAVLVPWVLKAVVQLPAQLQIQKQMQRDAPKLIELQLAASELSQKFLLDSQRFVKEYQALCRKNNINPFVAQFRPFLGALALMPCHLSIFVAFRNMERFSPGWNVEGFFWFQDLNAPDCYTALPLATTCLTMAAIKISASYISDPQHQRIMHMLSFVFGCGTLPLMAYLGSGFNLYCCSNILSTVAMSALLRNTQFRALFGLKPNTKVDENGNVVLVNPLAAAKVKAVGTLIRMMNDEGLLCYSCLSFILVLNLMCRRLPLPPRQIR